MRRKKRYALLKNIANELDERYEFIFQTKDGYTYKVDPKTAANLRSRALLISGSIRKIKEFVDKNSKSKG